MDITLLRWDHCDQAGQHFLLLSTEDCEHVRRRGRWVTNKVCEIYLQEVMFSTFTEKLSALVRIKGQ